ncbi:MAG: hypothetical protein IJ424_02000 [Oscillospiraceae bacterium]|nr:hypothetical protein [Oscillospiraceae bacterium]
MKKNDIIILIFSFVVFAIIGYNDILVSHNANSNKRIISKQSANRWLFF